MILGVLVCRLVCTSFTTASIVLAHSTPITSTYLAAFYVDKATYYTVYETVVNQIS